jgi:hypothetical protein
MPEYAEIQPEEPSWQERYDALYVRVSASAIARFLGVHPPWVNNYAKKLGFTAPLTESETGHAIHGYEKEVVIELQKILDGFPLQGTWLSTLDLYERTGVDRYKSKQVLAEWEIEPEQRRSNENKQLGQFYPPESEDIINYYKANRKLAGDWKTDWAIAQALGRSNDWVATRTARYQDASEERVTLSGNEEPHHSPEVFAILKAESDEFESYPYATDGDIAMRALAISVKRGDAWVRERLPYTSSEAKKKRDPFKGRLRTYISPNPHDDLIDMPTDVLSMEPAAYLKQRSAWIEQELARIKELRQSPKFAALSLKARIERDREYREIERDEVLGQERLLMDKKGVKKVSLGSTIPTRTAVPHGRPWQDFAACLDQDPELFFATTDKDIGDAKKVCAKCQVKTECLEHALVNKEREGIWGGLTVRERKRLQRPGPRY